jgi:hypothetical protein
MPKITRNKLHSQSQGINFTDHKKFRMSIPSIIELLIPSSQNIYFSIPKSQGIQKTIHGERGIYSNPLPIEPINHNL